MALRTLLAQMRPADLGLGKAGDIVLDRFQVKLLTEGSGTQVFSTTFAPMGDARSPAASPAGHVAGPLRPAPKAEADERDALREPGRC